MKSLIHDFVIAGVIAILVASGVSLLFALVAQLPKVGPVSLAAACESTNALLHWIKVFAVVFLLASILIFLREMRLYFRQNS